MRPRTAKRMGALVASFALAAWGCGSDSGDPNSGDTSSSGGGSGNGPGSGGTSAVSDDVARILSLTPNVDEGQQIYEVEAACITCHGANGEGVEFLGSAYAETLPQRTNEAIVDVVCNGSQSNELMAPACPDITDQQVADVIGYIFEVFLGGREFGPSE